MATTYLFWSREKVLYFAGTPFCIYTLSSAAQTQQGKNTLGVALEALCFSAPSWEGWTFAGRNNDGDKDHAGGFGSSSLSERFLGLFVI